MYTKRIALVTGANRGIGLEIARQLANLGHFVIMTSRQKQGEEAAHKMTKMGLEATHMILDVNRYDEIQEVYQIIEDRFGKLDILVNNAGVLLDGDTSFLELSENDLRMTIETNFFAPVRLIQTLVPLMQKQDYGRIVNVSSTMGSLQDMSEITSQGAAKAAAYRMSKAALNAATILFSKELMGTNILVNSACPGWVRTDMGGENALLSVEQGAKTPVWLATLPDNGPTGKFFRNQAEIPW